MPELCQKCSSLSSDLFRSNLIENPICSCGDGPETAEHYFLYCTKYVTARHKLKNNIELINIPFVSNVLLYGDKGESHETTFFVTALFYSKCNYLSKKRGFSRLTGWSPWGRFID